MRAGKCRSCYQISRCPTCNVSLRGFHHVGVRGGILSSSSIWPIGTPCGHLIPEEELIHEVSGGRVPIVYNGGPLWKAGYQWVNVFWGSFWEGNSWIDTIDRAVVDIESDVSYSGGLKQYGVGVGSLKGHYLITENPPAVVTSEDTGNSILSWIKVSAVPDVGIAGAYNILLPPGVSATLSGSSSCVQFCDYHDSASGSSGPFFTCEPYPCATGCNQCTSDPFDTLTQGLSEEMVELKTDMDPGTGWVIGNEELCDYCDSSYVCNRLPSGEYVNAWYDRSTGSCWMPQ